MTIKRRLWPWDNGWQYFLGACKPAIRARSHVKRLIAGLLTVNKRFYCSVGFGFNWSALLPLFIPSLDSQAGEQLTQLAIDRASESELVFVIYD